MVVIDLPFKGRRVDEATKREDGREFHRREVEAEKPALTLFILAEEGSTQ